MAASVPPTPGRGPALARNRQACRGSGASDDPQLPPPAPRSVDFAKEIRPILEKKCYSCHGPKKQKSDLRLDDKAAALRGGPRGRRSCRATVPRAPLILRVAGHRPRTECMPPKGERLTAEQVGMLRAWIDQGATWPEDVGRSQGGHEPEPLGVPAAAVARPLPEVRDGRLGAEPDRPVRPRPAGEGGADALARGRPGHPDPPAEPRPDRPAADDRGGRRLPRRHVARRLRAGWSIACWPSRTTASAGAGTGSTPPGTPTRDGYEKDKPRLHLVLPRLGDQRLQPRPALRPFIIEQLAGDLLPDATQDQIVATGFLRNSMINEEGGVDPEQFRMEAMFDRMDAIGKGDPRPDDPVRPVPQPQVRPDHPGGVLPALRLPEQRRRAGPRRLHARRADGRIAELHRQVARDRGRASATSTPDWRERMARWEDEPVEGAPAASGSSCRPPSRTSRPAARSTCPSRTARTCAEGYAPTKHTARLPVKTSTCRGSPPSASSC